MIWFTSDLHLGHRNVIEFCNRPFQSVEEMDEMLIANWNAVVRPDDTIYALGDMCFHYPDKGVPLLKRLMGRKILVQGNHDTYSSTRYFEAGFLAVVQEAVINFEGQRVRLSHYPFNPAIWAQGKILMSGQDVRYLERRPDYNSGQWLLCGHVHEKWKHVGNQINVGVDQWKMAPVAAGQIASIMARNPLA